MEGSRRGSRRRRALALIATLATLACMLAALGASPARAAEPPAFGIESFSSSFAEPPFSESGIESFSTPLSEPFLDRGGTAVTQAGAHPYAVTATIVFKHLVEKEEVVDPGGTPEEEIPTEVLTGGNPKNLAVSFPAGMVVDPQAVPKCEEASLESDSCRPASAVGLIAAYVAGFPNRVTAPLYNMVAPGGAPAQFGTNLAGLGFIVHVDGKLGTDGGLGGGYALSAEVTDILDTYPIYAVAITLWGDPSSPAHDAERGSCGEYLPWQKAEGEGASCPLQPNETSETPFLSMPTSCSGETLESSIAVESWMQPGVVFGAESKAPALTGCDELEFKPAIEVGPESAAASAPTGLRVDLHVPQNEQVGELATANLKNAVITLPEGMTIDPSSADGLTSCPLLKGIEPEKEAREQKGEEKGINLESSEPANCPNASKIGTVEVRTPLFEKPLPGSVYLAKPYENPFGSPEHPGGSLLAVYIVVDDAERGVIIKLAAEVKADPGTGRLTMTLKDNPQLPIEDFELSFYGGPRGLLVTPPACGTATTSSELTPWSGEAAATPSGGFQIDEGCGHGFAPTLLAGGGERRGRRVQPVHVDVLSAGFRTDARELQPHNAARPARQPLRRPALRRTPSCTGRMRTGLGSRDGQDRGGRRQRPDLPHRPRLSHRSHPPGRI